MLLRLLLVLFLQHFVSQNSGFSAAERCNYEKNNGCESGFSYIGEEERCLDVINFSCPKNTGKVFEFVKDPYLCNVHHACHRGTEIDRVCCASTEIFSITQRSCIQVGDIDTSLIWNCVSDPCAELMTTEVCNFQIVLPITIDNPTDFCNGTTTTAGTTSTTTSTIKTTIGNTEPQETTTNPQTITTRTSTGNTGPQETTANPQTMTTRTSTGNTGPQETTAYPQTMTTRTSTGNTGPQETTIYPSTSAKPGPPDECTAANEGEYYCDPEDPHGFYYCFQGELIHSSCIGINVFDCQNKVCIPGKIRLFQVFKE